MARLAIFIDGGYLTALAEREFGIWVDFEKLPIEIQKVVAAKTPEPLDLLRTHYYDCLPYQSNPPTEAEIERFAKARRFHDFIGRLPRFIVREGRLKFKGLDANKEPIFQQKRVDLMLGLDIALLSAKHQVTHIAIIAGDSDLLPAFEVARSESISVWLFHGPRTSKIDGSSSYAGELWTAADERHEIDMAFMKSIERAQATKPISKKTG
jgi:uncharacterized LabA/DUF88 family protein